MKMKFLKFMLVLSRTLLALAFLLGLLFAISILPIENNYKLYSVMSGSMAPAIPVGSLVLVMPAREYQQGDVVTFISHGARSDRDTTTHRIVGIVRDGGQKLYITKGDANEEPDAKAVTERNVIGKQLASIALAGFLLQYLVSLPGLIILVLIPALAFIVLEMIQILTELKNIRYRRAIGASER